jgi:hypothetical protein
VRAWEDLSVPPDYLSEDDLIALGVEPVLVAILCPWAVELTGHDGLRCWAAEDLARLFDGGVR